ncbi:MAG TPA: hypothetical protein VFD43_05210 [Planctomycetota bacterium]|nr:hypothetical protein [Planctomycetota bacterium]
MVHGLLSFPGMSSQRVVRMAHRGFLVELRLTQAARGQWQAQWSVFRKPLSPVAHGVVTSAHTLRDGAQAAATRGALAWIDTQDLDVAPAAASV